jgi:hypothetical protein
MKTRDKRGFMFLLLVLGLGFAGCDNPTLDEKNEGNQGASATETPGETASSPGSENGGSPEIPGAETPDEAALSPGGENEEGQNIPGGTDPGSIPEVAASVGGLAEVLAALAENTADTPYRIRLEAVEIDNESSNTSSFYSGNNAWSRVNRAVGLGKRFVVLDLSRCSFKGNEISSAGGFSSYGFSPQGNNMAIIKNNQYIKGIVLPEGLKTIGQHAFTSCSYLTSMVIPQSVTAITDTSTGDAFYSCDGLAYVKIPADLAEAFCGSYSASKKGITGLNMVLTGPGLIADWGLGDCEELTYVGVDETCVNYSSVEGVLFSKDQTSILYYPQGRTGSYRIPSGVTAIGERAFSRCGGLSGVLFPPDLREIGRKES